MQAQLELDEARLAGLNEIEKLYHPAEQLNHIIKTGDTEAFKSILFAGLYDLPMGLQSSATTQIYDALYTLQRYDSDSDIVDKVRKLLSSTLESLPPLYPDKPWNPRGKLAVERTWVSNAFYLAANLGRDQEMFDQLCTLIGNKDLEVPGHIHRISIDFDIALAYTQTDRRLQNWWETRFDNDRGDSLIDHKGGYVGLTRMPAADGNIYGMPLDIVPAATTTMVGRINSDPLCLTSDDKAFELEDILDGLFADYLIGEMEILRAALPINQYPDWAREAIATSYDSLVS